MNCGPCCIPGCPDAEDDTCGMAGHMLCYPHAAEIYGRLTQITEWPEREAAIHAHVARMVAEAKEKQPPVQLKRVGGYT